MGLPDPAPELDTGMEPGGEGNNRRTLQKMQDPMAEVISALSSPKSRLSSPKSGKSVSLTPVKMDAKHMGMQHWHAAFKKVKMVMALDHVKPKVVKGARLAARLDRSEAQTVNAPSSEHGPAVRVSVRIGVHGDTVGRDYEASNVNLGANPHKLCRKQLGRMSAAAIGRACAEMDATARRVIKVPWENPAMSAGGASLFDPTLGGGRVFQKRGDSRSLRAGDSVMCQHRGAGNNRHWYGRLGYRSVSALETYRADLLENKLTGANGPWMLLPSKPSSVRRRDHLARSVPELSRTNVRPQSRLTWDKYAPDLIFGNYRHLQSVSVPLGLTLHMDIDDEQDAPEDGRSTTIGIVQLNRLWTKLLKDEVGRVWYELSLEVQRFAAGKNDYELKLAKAVKKKKAADALRIETLLKRAEYEKEEADAAIERVAKERAEFEKAMLKFQEEKQELEDAICASEQDGVIDDEEAQNLMKMKIDVSIAEARLKKEAKEFEDWEAQALKELDEYDVVKARCEREIAEQKMWLEQAAAREEEHSKMQNNADFPHLSVLCRLHACRPRSEADHENKYEYFNKLLDVDIAASETDNVQYASVFQDQFCGYEGQWYNSKPDGYGVETLLDRGIQYTGHFENDLWHGWGMMALINNKAAYIGNDLFAVPLPLPMPVAQLASAMPAPCSLASLTTKRTPWQDIGSMAVATDLVFCVACCRMARWFPPSLVCAARATSTNTSVTRVHSLSTSTSWTAQR